MPSHCKAVVVLLWCCVYGTMITEGEEPSVCPGEAEGDCPEKVAFWAENQSECLQGFEVEVGCLCGRNIMEDGMGE